MGRSSKIKKEALVVYDERTNYSKCRLCEKKLKGYILGNIRRHYELIHHRNFDEIAPSPSDKDVCNRPSSSLQGYNLENIKRQHEVENNYNFDEIAPSTSDKSFCNRRSSDQFGLKLNKNDFLKCCVGLVTVKDIPVRIFDDEFYFKPIIEPYEKQYNVDLNSTNIVEHINLCANRIKNMLKQSLSNKMISLKLDVAARMGKSILGINVQYIKDFKIVVNTIGMIQLRKRRTANYLKDEILKCLQKFDIDLVQIYSTTSDNGANMLEASKLLAQDILDLQNTEVETITESENDDYEVVQDNLDSVMAVVRCAAHTIQMAVHDSFKDMQNKLEDCREIVNNLRASITSGCNSTDIRLPSIDNITRWISTFEMMESLLELKEHINANEVEFFIDIKIDWHFIENFVNVFTPMAECTKQLQAEQYIIGDFYRDWLVCEAKLKIMRGNTLAENLLESMRKGKEQLLDNDAFLSALYFDPRFNFLDSPYINDDQTKSAMVHILRTNATLNSLNEERHSSSEWNERQEDESVSPNDRYNILEKELNILISSRVTTQNSANIRQKLDKLAYGQRIPFATDVLEHWKNNYIKERDLCKLAEVILAAPSSQASVERSFSALSVITTKQASRLSNETINNLLIVKLNNNLLENV